MYEYPTTHNRRQYTWVDMTTLCPSDDAKRKERQEKLAHKFGFSKMRELDKEVKLDRGYGSAWLDMVVWRKELMKRADTSDVRRMYEDSD